MTIAHDALCRYGPSPSVGRPDPVRHLGGGIAALLALAGRLMPASYVYIVVPSGDRAHVWEAKGARKLPDAHMDLPLMDVALTLVEDALEHEASRAHPWVTGNWGIRSYMALALKDDEGQVMGHLWALDKNCRRFAPQEIGDLEEIGRSVAYFLGYSLSIERFLHAQGLALRGLAHDLKNPLSTLPVVADLLNEVQDRPEHVEMMCQKIKEACYHMNDLIDATLR